MKNKRGFFIYIMDNTLNDFELLRSKEILAILDGDTEFGTINGRRISMPYLSGPVLCDISLSCCSIRNSTRLPIRHVDVTTTVWTKSGVTSLILVTSRPQAESARIAASLPEPDRKSVV